MNSDFHIFLRISDEYYTCSFNKLNLPSAKVNELHNDSEKDIHIEAKLRVEKYSSEEPNQNDIIKKIEIVYKYLTDKRTQKENSTDNRTTYYDYNKGQWNCDRFVLTGHEQQELSEYKTLVSIDKDKLNGKFFEKIEQCLKNPHNTLQEFLKELCNQNTLGDEMVEKINNALRSIGTDDLSDDVWQKSEVSNNEHKREYTLSGENKQKTIFKLDKGQYAELIKNTGTKQIESIEFYYRINDFKEKIPLLRLDRNKLNGDNFNDDYFNNIEKQLNQKKTNLKSILDYILDNNGGFLPEEKDVIPEPINNQIPKINVIRKTIDWQNSNYEDILDDSNLKKIFLRNFYKINNKEGEKKDSKIDNTLLLTDTYYNGKEDEKKIINIENNKEDTDKIISEDFENIITFFEQFNPFYNVGNRLTDSIRTVSLKNFINSSSKEGLKKIVLTHGFITFLINNKIPASMIKNINESINSKIKEGDNMNLIIKETEQQELSIKQNKNWLAKLFWLSKQQRRVRELKEQLTIPKKNSEKEKKSDSLIQTENQVYENEQIINIDRINNLNSGRLSCCGL